MRRTRLKETVQCLLLLAIFLFTLRFPAANAYVGAVPLSPTTITGVSGIAARHGDPSDGGADQATDSRVTRMMDGKTAVTDRIIVRFRNEVSTQEQGIVHQAVATAWGSATPRTIGQITDNTQIIALPATLSIDRAITVYRADPHVLYAQPDYIRYATDIPNDPSFGTQWGLAKVSAPAAWNVTHGSAAVTIAILDCGIHATHPDLISKVVLANDFTNSASGTDDRCNHGTHVAGIAGARTNNSTGVAGMGYDSQLLNGKVLNDSGFGPDSTIAAGIAWAVANGAKVINLSLSGYGACSDAPVLQDAITAAWNKNVVVVVAAGNSGTSDIQTPASCANVLSVASTNTADARSSFSSYGSWVKIAAPGEAILSTVNPDRNNGDSYATFSGTSMATPLVSGLVALLWTTRYGTSASSVTNRLTGTADQIAGTGSAWQYGRVNAAAALTIPPAPTLTALSPAAVVSGGGGFTLTLTGANFVDGAVMQWNGGARVTGTRTGNTLTAAIPAAEIAQIGTARITVTNPDGQISGTLAFAVLAAAPRVSAISPATGLITGGATITLHGANFQSNATVMIGGQPATAVIVVSTTITCITPAGAVGQADVIVANPDGQHDTLPNSFTYALHPLTAPSSVIPDATATTHITVPKTAVSATPLPAPTRH